MSVRSPGYGPRIGVKWGDLADKPATFPPAAHTHSYASLTDIPVTFAPAPHTHAWADITGKPTTFAPSAHTHAGLLSLVGTVTVGETLLLALSLGVKRYAVTMTGLAVGDRVIALLTGAPGPSSLQDVYVSAANTLNVGLLNPALGIGSVIAVPIAVYKVT